MTYLHFIKEFMVDNHDVILMHLSVYKYEQMQMVHDIIISHYIPNINYFPLESKQILNFHDGVLLNNEMDTMTTIQYKYKLNSYVGMETINMYKNTDILNIWMENSDMVVKELDIINDQNLNNVIVQDVNNFKNIVLNENQIKLFNEILQNYLENLNKDEIFHVNEIVRDDYILKNNLQSSLNLELSHQNSVVLNNFDINSEVVNSYKTTNIFDFDKSYE